MKSRDYSLDILRTIGILLIFLAHTECSFLIKQLRNFDVILLVIISGYVYKEPQNYFNYIWKRMKRLAFPTWTFLTIFFLSIYLVKYIFNVEINILNVKTIASSYLFWLGIGFVWIIRVYIGTSILSPILLKKLNGNLIYILVEIFTLIIIKNYKYDEIIKMMFLLPYILIFCYGKLLKDEKISLKKFTLVLGILIIAFMVLKKDIYINIQNYKYLPRMVYIWYGIFVSNLLFLIKDKINLKNKILNNFCKYIGKSTMWFYLLHIIIYYFITFLKKYVIDLNWIVEYIFLVILSLFILVVKDYILRKLYKIFPDNNFLKLFEG